jgi:acetoacetate decarboxylase
MQPADILALPSMPMASPSYPAGPYRFVDREYMVITYETDPVVIRAQLGRLRCVRVGGFLRRELVHLVEQVVDVVA